MHTLNRRDLLKIAGMAGAAGVVGGPSAVANAARTALAGESGALQVLDWAGYGNDGGQSMFAQYVHQHPGNKPKFTNMTNEADALAKRSETSIPSAVAMRWSDATLPFVRPRSSWLTKLSLTPAASAISFSVRRRSSRIARRRSPTGSSDT